MVQTKFVYEKFLNVENNFKFWTSHGSLIWFFFMKLQNRCCPQIPWSAMIKLSLVWRPGTNSLHHSLMIYFAWKVAVVLNLSLFKSKRLPWELVWDLEFVCDKKIKSTLNKRCWVQGTVGHGHVGAMWNIFLFSDRAARRCLEVDPSPISCCQRTARPGRKQPGHSWANASCFHPFRSKSFVEELCGGSCWGGQEEGEGADGWNPNSTVAVGQSRLQPDRHMGCWEVPVCPPPGSQALFKGESSLWGLLIPSMGSKRAVCNSLIYRW